MAKTKFVEDGISIGSKPPPPPLPPPRGMNRDREADDASSNASSSSLPMRGSAPPPPVARSSKPNSSNRPSLPGRAAAPSDSVDRIDWANLSAEDKEEFFRWLDEFFTRYLGRPVGTSAPAAPAPTRWAEPKAEKSGWSRGGSQAFSAMKSWAGNASSTSVASSNSESRPPPVSFRDSYHRSS